VVQALKRSDHALTYAAIEFLNALMQVQKLTFVIILNPRKKATVFFSIANAQRLRSQTGATQQIFTFIVEKVS
jgi:hypothetical protein